MSATAQEDDSRWFAGFNGLNDDLITFLVYLLGGTVVALCIIMKVPQIFRVVKSKTTLGLSLTSLLLELYVFTLLFTYQFSKAYPITAYFEYSTLIIQDLVLLWMVLTDRQMLNLQCLAVFGLYLSFSTALALNMLPPYVVYILISTVTPSSAFSKLIQLKEIVVNRDPGQVSAITWGIATYTASVRVFTTIMQTGDVAMLITIATAAVLNCAIFTSVIYYGSQRKDKRQ